MLVLAVAVLAGLAAAANCSGTLDACGVCNGTGPVSCAFHECPSPDTLLCDGRSVIAGPSGARKCVLQDPPSPEYLLNQTLLISNNQLGPLCPRDLDCAGLPGVEVADGCGVCGGDNSTCGLDLCGVAGGNGTSCCSTRGEANLLELPFCCACDSQFCGDECTGLVVFDEGSAEWFCFDLNGTSDVFELDVALMDDGLVNSSCPPRDCAGDRGGAAIYDFCGLCGGAATAGDIGDACDSGLPGVCAAGGKQCSGENLICVAVVAPGQQAEVCDTLDNDCDGEVDEGRCVRGDVIVGVIFAILGALAVMVCLFAVSGGGRLAQYAPLEEERLVDSRPRAYYRPPEGASAQEARDLESLFGRS